MSERVEAEIEALARRVAREEIERALAATDRIAPWITVEEAAKLLGTTPGAIHQRLHSGWLAGETIREGKRRLINRKALLAELDRKRPGRGV